MESKRVFNHGKLRAYNHWYDFLPNYMGIMINQPKDPVIKQPGFNDGKYPRGPFFVA